MDGFTSKAMFVEGESKKFDEIKTVHEYKPAIKYESSFPGGGYAAVIEETFPAELTDFIDWDNVYIYSSDINGNPTKNVVKTRIDKPKDGVINTFNSPAMSHKNVSTNGEVAKVRSYIQSNVLTAAAGQVGFYTISYKLKDSLKDPEAAKKIIEAAKQTDNNSFLPFSSRLYADWPDNKIFGFNKDDGAPWKILENSEHNSVLDVRDTDGDGLIDFIEYQFGSNPNLVDTDGDGVPDGQEALVDNTKPNDASDYIVKAPTAENTTYNPAVENKIKGTLPKPLIKNPAKPEEDLKVTNKAAGDAIVKLHPYDAKTKTYDKDKVIAEVKIPFDKLEKGEFEIPLPANKVEDGSKAQIVAYAPNGEHSIDGPVLNFNLTDADRFKPEAEKETVPFGGKYNLTDNIKKFKDAKGSAATPELDNKTPFEDVTAEDAINVNKPGEYTGKVRVKYKDGSTEDVEVPVTVLAKVIDQTKNPDANTPEGYVRVTFEQGEHGTFAKDSKTVLDVVKGTLKSDVTVPTVAPAENFKHTGWTPEIPENFDNGGTFTAKYAAAQTDAEKYTAEGGTVNKPYGEKATEEDVKKKVTVKDGSNQTLPAAEQKKVVKEIKVGEIPEPGKDGGNQTVPVTVVYEDGTKDDISVTIDYSDAKDKYAPEGQKVTVSQGAEEPKAEDAIKNKDKMPEGTKYAWKTPIDTNTAGERKATVTVTYPDGSKEDVEVDFEVRVTTPAQTDAEKYTAEGGTVNKPYGEKATEAEITDAVTTNAPNERVKSKKIIGDIPTTGVDQPVDVEITYADGSVATVQVFVSYGKAKDAFDPTGKNLSVKQNDGAPSPADAITNKDALPANTGYSWTTPVNTTEVGTHEYTVKITYPDGSEDFVKVNVTVEATAPAQTDAEKYKADGGKVNKPYGQTATAEEVVDAVTTDAPKDKVKSIKVVGSIPTKGKNQPVKVDVTYADGTKDTVTVTVNYMDAADAFNPETKPITVDKGQAPDAKDGIANKDEFPEGTTITWKKPVDTKKPGEKEGTVVVTYPDGSKDEVTVKVVVQDKKSQADENEPKVKEEVIKEGEKPDLTDNVTNLDKLPKGTKVKDITPDGAINPNKPGEYEGTLEIEYPDGSKDTVKVKVVVTKKNVASSNTDSNNNGKKPSGSDNGKVHVNSSSPKTGDTANLSMFAGIMGMAGSLLALIGFKKRKKEDERE